MYKYLIRGCFYIYRGKILEKKAYLEKKVSVFFESDVYFRAIEWWKKDFWPKFGEEPEIVEIWCEIVKIEEDLMDRIRDFSPDIPVHILRSRKNKFSREDLWEIANSGNEEVKNWSIDALNERSIEEEECKDEVLSS